MGSIARIPIRSAVHRGGQYLEPALRCAAGRDGRRQLPSAERVTMAKNKKLLILAGDGIGPEVMRQVARVLDWFAKRRALSFEVQDGLVGGCSIDKHGVPITDVTMVDAMVADVVLLGVVGGSKWDNLPFEKKPERGLFCLRKDMELFANLRPALVFDVLVDASSLKSELVRGFDLMIVRELTGGVYFGSPRVIETLPDG